MEAPSDMPTLKYLQSIEPLYQKFLLVQLFGLPQSFVEMLVDLRSEPTTANWYVMLPELLGDN
jgi:hypothetical protein